MERTMLKPPYLLAVAAAATTLSLPASAQGVLAERNISLGLAMTIAQSALESCRANGFHVSVTVVDRAGQVRVALRDDNASPHTFENSQRKAYTARTFRVPSAEFATRMAGDPVKAQLVLPGVIARAPCRSKPVTKSLAQSESPAPRAAKRTRHAPKLES